MPSKLHRSISLADFPAEPANAAGPQISDRLNAIAEQVRALYYLVCRMMTGRTDIGEKPNPRWDGGQDGYGRFWKPVWPKIAKHLLAIQAEPMSYIQAQFAGISSDRLPFPNMFWSDAAVSRYRTYLANAKDDLKRKLRYESVAIRAEVTLLQEVLGWHQVDAMRRALLTDDGVNASPLLRYCLAVEYGLHDVAEQYHAAALLQYVFQRSLYDEVWTKCIPASLRDEGADLAARFAVS